MILELVTLVVAQDKAHRIRLIMNSQPPFFKSRRKIKVADRQWANVCHDKNKHIKTFDN